MEFLEFKKFLMKSTNYMFSDQFYENISESYLKNINKDINESELFVKYFVDLLNFTGKNVYGEIYEKALEKGYDGSRKKLTMMIKEYLLNNGIKFKDKRTATERYFIIEK